MPSGDGPVDGIWKSIALICITILIAGSPGLIYALRTWSVSDEVRVVRDRQDDVRDRLARLEVQVTSLQIAHQTDLEDIRQLQAQLANRPPGAK
jgi:hypothetical protein